MVVVLTGENSFALRSDLRALVAAFAAEHGDIATEHLDGEEASFGRLQESLQSSPFLAARKLVVLQSPGANKQFAEQAGGLLAGLPETTDVYIVEPKVDKRSGYYKLLKKAGEFREYSIMDEHDLSRWLVQAAKTEGGSISAADARFLVERVGADQQLLSHELEKLMAYDAAITRKTIELLSEPTLQSKVFDLLEAAFAGNAAQALALYHDQREQKVDPAQIISMLAWQLKVITLVKMAGERSVPDTAASTKLSPFTIQKNLPAARRLSAPKLKQLVAALLALDVRSKRENIDLDEALQNFILSLAGQ